MYDEDKVKEALELCEDIKEFYEPQKAKNQRKNVSGVRTIYVPVSSNGETDREKKKASRFFLWIKNIGSFLICILIAYGMARLITDYLVQPTSVEGISMENTLLDNDILLINKLSYRFHDPKRFDIVIFPYSMNEYYVKRVIGLPGETVFIEDGIIYINEKPLPEQYGREKIMDPGIAKEPLMLGEDELFVMGDNRNHSMDSRSDLVGPISKEKIGGKVWLRVYPFESFQKFN